MKLETPTPMMSGLAGISPQLLRAQLGDTLGPLLDCMVVGVVEELEAAAIQQTPLKQSDRTDLKTLVCGPFWRRRR